MGVWRYGRKDAKVEKMIFAKVEIYSPSQVRLESVRELVMQLENKAESQTVGEKNLNLLGRHAIGISMQ